jgi:hypothetical protein
LLQREGGVARRERAREQKRGRQEFSARASLESRVHSCVLANPQKNKQRFRRMVMMMAMMVW